MTDQLSSQYGPLTRGIIQGIYNIKKSIYNPVLFCGKTEITSGICAEIAHHFIDIGQKVSWVTADEFTQMLVDALMFRKYNDFRNMLFPCDVLIIENVETLSGRASTQEEFYYLFDRVYENNSQIILSSLMSPNLITNLEDRVKTQLMAGIYCRVDE